MWLVECDIEGVVGKVTPVFKYSQPFLSKIVAISKRGRNNGFEALPKEFDFA